MKVYDISNVDHARYIREPCTRLCVQQLKTKPPSGAAFVTAGNCKASIIESESEDDRDREPARQAQATSNEQRTRPSGRALS